MSKTNTPLSRNQRRRLNKKITACKEEASSLEASKQKVSSIGTILINGVEYKPQHVPLEKNGIRDDDRTMHVASPVIPPGGFLVYKKLDSKIIAELIILPGFETNLMRSVRDARFAKYRCSGVYVSRMYDMDTGEIRVSAWNIADGVRSQQYETHNIVAPDRWDSNYSAVCSSGIHFFITLEAAKLYSLNLSYIVTQPYFKMCKFHDDGILHQSTEYLYGKRHGQYIVHDGYTHVWNYKDDVRHGEYKRTDGCHGITFETCTYRNGGQTGPATKWNHLIDFKDKENAGCETKWSVVAEGNLVDGILQGDVIYRRNACTTLKGFRDDCVDVYDMKFDDGAITNIKVTRHTATTTEVTMDIIVSRRNHSTDYRFVAFTDAFKRSMSEIMIFTATTMMHLTVPAFAEDLQNTMNGALRHV